jgi:Ni/Co efflux regulator RcnB
VPIEIGTTIAKRRPEVYTMKSDYLRKNIGRILLAFSFIAGIGFLSSTAVQAQRPWERNQDRQDRRDRDRDYRRDRDNDRDRDYNRNDQYRRNNGGYGNGGHGNGGYGGYGNASQIAMNQGYQDGLYTGSSDAQRGQSYNPQRSHFYRNGRSDNGGYYGGYQNPQAYRSGFLRGYDEGFRRNGGYNRNRRSNGNYRFPW